jgi:primosomal protein N' (replication factor Y) (superfamily II helicase)
MGDPVLHTFERAAASDQVRQPLLRAAPQYAGIVIPPVHGVFTYLVPVEFPSQLGVGSIVVVPFGKRTATGFVVTMRDEPQPQATEKGTKLKPVLRQINEAPGFLPEQLPLLEWMADYYCEPLSAIIDLAVPKYFNEPSREIVRAESRDPSDFAGSQQRKVFEALAKSSWAIDRAHLIRSLEVAPQVLRLLQKQNKISVSRVPQHRAPRSRPKGDATQMLADLNEEQGTAFHEIEQQLLQNSFCPFLLHGITGSGKTEVYINLAARALEQNKGVLVLVPEIALTPQLISRFISRLNVPIAILHSGIGARQRWNYWNELIHGEVRIAIGARSAIFAPVRDLGLLIVDEEHDASFKQSEGIRYNARDVALVRAKLASCPIVLGSATPCLETYHSATKGKYRLLTLRDRHRESRLPKLSLIDLNQVKPWEQQSALLSPELFAALGENLARKEQSFLLYNRRGFASYLQCVDCGGVIECPHCSVTMVLYQQRRILLCHYCGHSTSIPEYCSGCFARGAHQSPPVQSGELKARGAGTERAFDEVAALFPEAKMLRLDREAASNSEEYEAALRDIMAGEVDIVVGTQLIAKGHDIARVTLAAVLDCDVGLHMPDFRAGERAFQLLTQAVGRAGRGIIAGRAILQTRVPQHPSIIAASKGLFENFAREELDMRRRLRYPPFSRLARVVSVSKSSEAARDLIETIAATARSIIEERGVLLDVMGPTPAPIERLRGYWRWHLLFRSEHASHMNRCVKIIKKVIKTGKFARFIVDIDPQDMM